MNPTKFDPARLPSPDALGFFMHPDVPGDEESDDVAALIREMGFKASLVSFEFDADEYDVNRWFDDQKTAAEIKAVMERWSPTPPDGGDWVLVGKFDTDDGPYAMLVLPDPKPSSLGGGA